MVYCLAYGCSNRSGGSGKSLERKSVGGDGAEPSGSSEPSQRAVAGGVSASVPTGSDPSCFGNDAWKRKCLIENVTFHTFPKEPLRAKWVAKFNRDKSVVRGFSRLCSAHFEPDCFEDSYWLKIRLGQAPKVRTLKPDAVPTIFVRSSSGNVPQPRVNTEARLKRKAQREEIAQILAKECDVFQSEKRNEIQDEPVQNLDSNTSTHNKNTQTCLESVMKKSVGVGVYMLEEKQPMKPVTKRNFGTQTERRDLHDVDVQTDREIENEQIGESTDSESKVEIEDSTESEMDITYDPSWDAEEHSEELSGGDSNDDIEEAELLLDGDVTPVTDKKFIVFGKELDELLRFCPQCGSAVLQRQKSTKGSLLSVQLFCQNNHTIVWRSQPICNYYPMGNVLLSAACLFAGATFTRLHQISKFMGLQIHSISTFFRHQKDILFPIIGGAWKKEQDQVLQELSQRDTGITLIGDGRCDSPGFSAKYGTYSVMDSKTSKIAAFEVVQVTEVASSVAMEKEGLKRVLEKLKEHMPPIMIETLATDRHIQIAKMMADQYGHIDHQNDLWHVVKNTITRINEKSSKTKKYAILKPWIQFISNHLWWSSATCGGDEQQLRERWTSVVHHICDKHEWDTGTVYHKCAHAPLDDTERGEKLWLKPGSEAHKLLQSVVFDKKLLETLKKLTKFCHTGPLEVAHSLYLKYCPKRQHFSHKGMVARTMLAALDNNRNVGRSQATIQSGEKKGETRYNIVFPKNRKQWVAKPIMEKKSYEHIYQMMSTVNKSCARTAEASELCDIIVPDLAPNISRQQKPDKEDIVSGHKSRMLMGIQN